MTLNLGRDVTDQPRVPDDRIYDIVQYGASEQTLAVLRLNAILDQLVSAIGDIPQPEVHVDPVDLTDIVTAVNGLKPGADAKDIAAEIAKVLHIPQAEAPDFSVLGDLTKALETLDFRLKGLGSGAGGSGGGTVYLNEDSALRVTNMTDQVGTWGYNAGSSGTVNITAGKRITGIAAHASGPGTVAINGGTAIPIPSGLSFSLTPQGNLVDPTIVFTGTDTYTVEWLQ